MRVLVTGGAGYIGSHTVRQLKRSGHEPLVLDNYSTGHRAADKHAPLIEADLLDREALARCFREHPADAVMHFAARSLVGESMQAPYEYYENNVAGSLNLFKAAMDAGVSLFIFSSTAAVYGQPDEIPILETSVKAPLNVYGKTKLIIENILEDFSDIYASVTRRCVISTRPARLKRRHRRGPRA
jgi:UDP-glucose 4-epimerase